MPVADARGGIRRLCILGATGSIGSQTLQVVERNPERYSVHAVTGATSIERMTQICLQFAPKVAAMTDAASAAALRERLRDAGCDCEVLVGDAALAQIAGAPDSDTVVAGIVGAAGLASTWAAVRAGKRVLLANKESMVMAGRLLMTEVARAGAELLPIDSEHNAILQALPQNYGSGLSEVGVRRLLLTASGGPFRTTPLAELNAVTPAQACKHPNWPMGRKISVDSATMLNKGLEVIEARWLFDAAPDMIDVVVHPQSIVHSLVEYRDGSVLAQLSHPDMRVPIAHALAFPQRIESGARYLDLFELARLEFERPDLARFPCLGLAFQALRAGSDAPVVLNAANEIAVAAFLDEQIGYTQIAAVIEATLAGVSAAEPKDLGAVMEIDRQARDEAARQVILRAPRKAA